jgi:hypothetical protein
MIYLMTPSTISVTKFMHLLQVTMNATRTLECFDRMTTSNFSKQWKLNLMIMRLVIIGHSCYKKTCLGKPKQSWLFGHSNINVTLMARLTNTRLDYVRTVVSKPEGKIAGKPTPQQSLELVLGCFS